MTEQFDQAIGTYEQLILQNPQDIRLQYNLAEAYFSAGNTSTALAHFDRLKNLPGITPNVFLRVAACHEKLGNPRQAKNSLEELLKKNLPPEARKQLEIAHNKLMTQYKLS
jgi:tetratricopeptide (TPR) repeat protein